MREVSLEVHAGQVVGLTVRVPDGPRVQGQVRVVWSRALASTIDDQLYSYALGLEALAS